jgi:hypothetical protein
MSMKPSHTITSILVACLLVGVFSVQVAAAADRDDLNLLLKEFLASAHEEAAHQKFWADDLVYTSSNGTRFGKSEILDGFGEPSDEPPAVIYSAADIDIRTYGVAAIVAFKLVGKPSDGSAVLEYFNTGTFLKREGRWQVVAWQATVIPSPPASAD